MTPAAIELVRQSWRAADTRAVVASFYATLFAADRGVETLFLGDPAALRRKFDETLSAIVEHLDEPGAVSAKVRALGARHAGYGVQPRHYALVEDALVAALGEQLGERFDAATEAAWREAYAALASGMLDGELEATIGASP